MKVLCDVHLPYRLVNQLRTRGVDATQVNRIRDGTETKDAAVAAFADANGITRLCEPLLKRVVPSLDRPRLRDSSREKADAVV
jgi:hypothetical protein